MSYNPLLAPPFYTIPGINPEDPISAQLEQIDQLNTLLLQDIDHNFARFHQVVTTKLLPEIKRFALASEPTREASKFWRSFFEAAANVQVPIPGEFTATESQASGSPRPAHQEQYEDHEEILDNSITSDDASFLFGHGASSSTPLAARNGKIAIDPDDSWASSMESPFDRLDKKLREGLKLGEGDDLESVSQPTRSLPEGYSYGGTRSQGQQSQLEQYDEEPSVLISRRDWDVSGAQRRPVAPASTSSAAAKDKAATPKALNTVAKAQAHGPAKSPRRPHPTQNPFSSATPSTSRVGGGSTWNGIADLRHTPLNPKLKKPSHGPASSTRAFEIDDDMDDTEDDLTMGLGMSPPVTMNFTLPSRTLAKTPAKEAAKLVLDDLMREMGGGGTPSPVMPTPPSFAKYGMASAAAAGSPSQGRRLFREALGEDAAALVEDEEDVTILRGRPLDDSLDDATQSTGGPEDSQDDILGENMREEDTYHAGHFQQDASYEQSTITGQSRFQQEADTTDLLHLNSTTLSPTVSEAGRVFGPSGGAGRGGGFNLFGPDEMQTFHGGRLEDAGTSIVESPSYGLSRNDGLKRLG